MKKLKIKKALSALALIAGLAVQNSDAQTNNPNPSVIYKTRLYERVFGEQVGKSIIIDETSAQPSNSKGWSLGITKIPINQEEAMQYLSKPMVLKGVSTDLGAFVNEISQYDILHFGESHPVSYQSTSTLEDFTRILLPIFKRQSQGGKSHDLIRAENLVYELNVDGSFFIPAEELNDFDGNGGIINPVSTPKFYSETFSTSGGFFNVDLYGTLKLAREAALKGYKVRGVYPKREQLSNIKNSVVLNGGNSVTLTLRTSAALTYNYEDSLTRDMGGGSRCIVYGGAVHNDNSDPFMLGVGDEMRKAFPGRYLSIDIFKPAVIATNKPYPTAIISAFGNFGIDVNKIKEPVYARVDNDPRADYVVILP